MKLVEINQNNNELFEEVHCILEKAFPEIERRTYENQKKLLELENYKIYCYIEESKVKGFITSWKLQNIRFIEHFAVDKSMRGKGIGGQTLKSYIGIEDIPIVLEVELPENDVAKGRIGFYQKSGFKLNKFNYEQLPLRKDAENLPLLIMSYPKELSKDEFETIKKELYTKVYGRK